MTGYLQDANQATPLATQAAVHPHTGNRHRAVKRHAAPDRDRIGTAT